MFNCFRVYLQDTYSLTIITSINVPSITYEEVCRNLMISQQLELICQPINNTFCMELHYNIPFTFTYLLAHLCYNRDSQTARESALLCESNGTSNNT